MKVIKAILDDDDLTDIFHSLLEMLILMLFLEISVEMPIFKLNTILVFMTIKCGLLL